MIFQHVSNILLSSASPRLKRERYSSITSPTNTKVHWPCQSPEAIGFLLSCLIDGLCESVIPFIGLPFRQRMSVVYPAHMKLKLLSSKEHLTSYRFAYSLHEISVINSSEDVRSSGIASVFLGIPSSNPGGQNRKSSITLFLAFLPDFFITSGWHLKLGHNSIVPQHLHFNIH